MSESAGESLICADQSFYAENGYLLLKGAISEKWLQRLRAGVEEVIAANRHLTTSTHRVGLHKTHSPEAPEFEWIWNPDLDSNAIWDFVAKSELINVVAGLIGDNVRFSHTSLLFKRPGVCSYDWHQDIAYMPHTNASLIVVGCHLADCSPLDARMCVIPGSHRGPMFAHTDESGRFTGKLLENDLRTIGTSRMVELTGPAGTIEFLHCKTLHLDDFGSQRNGGTRINITYTAADAVPYAGFGHASHRYGTIVKGQPARFARHDSEGCSIPRDFGEIDRRFSLLGTETNGLV